MSSSWFTDCSGLRVWGAGIECRAEGLGCRVGISGFKALRVEGLGCWVEGLEVQVWDVGLWLKDLRLRNWDSRLNVGQVQGLCKTPSKD